jgi:RNA polymerase sigma-70 factor, ECF subfamily
VTDERLLRSASRGNVEAFEELLGQLAPTLYTYLQGMLGDEYSAGEALEEACVRLARSLDRYERGAGVTSWALQVARRVAADAAPEVPPPGPWSAEVDHEWAGRALLSLSVADRELVVCRELLDWDIETIASTLGMTTEEVSGRLAAARDLLFRGPAQVNPT